jgi:hypothetical protein
MSELLHLSGEECAQDSAWFANRMFDEITTGKEKTAELEAFDTSNCPAVIILAIREKRASLQAQLEEDTRTFYLAVEEYGDFMAGMYD